MKSKPYPLDPRFLVFENGTVQNPSGDITFGSLWKCGRYHVTTTVNRKKKSYQVSRMVLITFKGDAPKDCVCSHLNGNSQDNRIENLAWETQKQNCFRKNEHGTAQRGSKNPAAKLCEEDVINIRRSTLSSREIAPIYGVADAHIRAIRRGRSWV